MYILYGQHEGFSAASLPRSSQAQEASPKKAGFWQAPQQEAVWQTIGGRWELGRVRKSPGVIKGQERARQLDRGGD